MGERSGRGRAAPVTLGTDRAPRIGWNSPYGDPSCAPRRFSLPSSPLHRESRPAGCRGRAPKGLLRYHETRLFVFQDAGTAGARPMTGDHDSAMIAARFFRPSHPSLAERSAKPAPATRVPGIGCARGTGAELRGSGLDAGRKSDGAQQGVEDPVAG